jgi:hypothetical protein
MHNPTALFDSHENQIRRIQNTVSTLMYYLQAYAKPAVLEMVMFVSTCVCHL